MSNEMKLLRAFIEASGFDVEEVNINPHGCHYDYKVTKKKVIKRGGRGSSKKVEESRVAEKLKDELSTGIQIVINDLGIDCGRHGNDRVINAITEMVMIGVLRSQP